MIVNSPFKPAWWLPGGHLQTLWPNLLRKRPRLGLVRERFELPDGDFVDLDWTTGTSGPLVLILHGLEGCSASPYAAGILRTLHDNGMRAVLMHFRGCSGEPNRLDRSYHSGETEDLHTVVHLLHTRMPHAPLAAIGYSLGGNVLLKWLGEQGAEAPLAAAVAVSVPFDLHRAARRLERGFSRLYQSVLLRSLRRSVARKFRHRACPFALNEALQTRSLREFDTKVTAPLHGFADADDYYTRSSCAQYLRGIRVPTLILHALDDVFMTADAVPSPEALSDSVTLELSASGGHVGFVAGPWSWRPQYWLEERIPAYLRSAMKEATAADPVRC